MAAVSIRNLDADVKQKLRLRAAQHGRSMESEIRAILIEAVTPPVSPAGLFVTILERFSELGGLDLDLPKRNVPPRGPALG
ncbi:MAG: FitA-like ribbon-helix-helix domain-containing protein [Actinomycetota bacterium]